MLARPAALPASVAWKIIALAIGVAAAAIGVLGARVAHLERGELQLEGQPRSIEELQRDPAATRVSVRLAEVELHVGERALFELCAEDPLTAAKWRDAFDLVVFRWNGAKPELMLRVPLDAEHLALAERNASGACLSLGGGMIEQGGRHTLEIVFAAKPPADAIARTALRGRVLAQTPLNSVDRGAVGALVGAVLVLLAALFMLPRRSASEAAGEPARESQADARDSQTDDGPALDELSGRAIALGGVAILSLIGATFLPMYGSALGLAKGALIVALQTMCALGFSGAWTTAQGASRRMSLGLNAPSKIWPWVASAPLVALGLAQCARIALRVVPSTGEAPIESFVSWPSGMLAFAAMGVIAPVAEELFFRGFLYRIALPFGRLPACSITLALFIALHLAQSWGNWGGVLAVALTGLVLTILRASSASVLPSALAHVLYNAALSLQALW